MERKFLEGLGLEKDAIDKIMSENGKDIKKEKDKSDEFERDFKDADSQLKQANDTIKDLKKNNVDNEELQKKVNQYETDIKNQKETYEKEINDMKYKNALEGALSKYSFQDDSAKEFVISKIKDKIEFKNGEFIGINDAITDIQKNQTYLFKEDPKGTGSFVTGGSDGGKDRDKKTLGEKEDIAITLGKLQAETIKGNEDFNKFIAK